MLRSLPARRLPKPLAVVLTVALALFWVLAVPPTSADAATYGGFNIDGAKIPLPPGVETVSDPLGNADTTVYSNGAKESQPESWQTNGSAGAPDSGDIGDSYIATGYDGDFWLYYAFERAASQGSMAYALELNQFANKTNGYGTAVPNRSVGDLKFTLAQGGNGDFSLVAAARWTGGGWSSYNVPNGAMKYATNSGKTFAEFAFNLSAILKGGAPIECGDLAAAQLWLRSQASNANDPQLKDFATGRVDVDSCASLAVKKVDENGNGLAGASFKISPNPKPDSTGDLAIRTDSNGLIKLGQINAGTYKVTELAPPAGYLIDTAEKQITINPTEDGSLTFTNSLGHVHFTKTYEGEKKPGKTGATFKLEYLRGWDYSGASPVLSNEFAGDFGPITVVDNGTADRDGNLGDIVLRDLPSGEWKVTETAAPAGWGVDPAPQTFRVGPGVAARSGTFVNPSTGKFTDPLLTAALRVVKTESSAGTSAPLEGVVFDLFKDNGDGAPQLGVNGGDDLVASETTNSAGLANWTGLNWQNKYWLRETVPAGYGTSLEPNPQLITLDVPTNANQVTTVNVDNPRQELSVSFNKTDASTGAKLTGGSFELWRDANGNGKWDANTDHKVGAKPLKDGNATWAPSDGDLPWGYVYFVYERTAPDGYGLMSPNPAATDKTTAADAGKTVSITATDPRLTVALAMKKVDNVGEPVQGASFTLYKDNGNGLFDGPDKVHGVTRSSSVDGSLSWTGLDWDAVYWVEENSAPNGYSVMTENPVKVTVEKVHAGKTLDLTNKPLVNPRVPTSLEVLKVDELDQTPLEGAVFSLWRDADRNGKQSSGDVLIEEKVTTDSRGKALFDKKMVWENQYLLVETKAPDGYDLVEPLVITVDRAQAGKTIKRTVEDPRTEAGLQVRKSDEDQTGLPVAGASFKLWQDTNHDGEFNPCGEIANGPCDQQKGGVHETDENGLTPVWQGLTYGYTYFLEEVATPNGYTGIARKTVELERSQANTVVVVDITNQRDAADLVITKLDGTTKNKMNGAKFELRRGGSATEPGTLVAEGAVTDGQLTFTDALVWGHEYWLYETSSGSADHSLMTPNPLKIQHAATASEFRNVIEVTVENPRNPSGVVVQKVDEHNDAAVEGAAFELYVDRDGNGRVTEADGPAIGTGATAATGTVEFTGLTWGVDYLLLEAKVPAGYQAIQPNPHPFTLDGPGTKVLTLKEPRITAGATMKKVDEFGEPVEGAQFDLYLDNRDGSFDATTDTKVADTSTGADGVLNWSGLHWGETYWVYETTAPDGYQVMTDNPRQIRVARDDAGTVLDLTSTPMVDPRVPTSLTALKVDGWNDKPLTGAKFTLWLDRDQDGAVTAADEPSVAETTTGGDGLIRFTDKLVWGNQYLLEEASAPDGYEAMSPNPVVVKVIKDNAGRVIDLTATPFEDPRAMSSLHVLKVDATDGTPLAGAEFALWRDADGNGKVNDGDERMAASTTGSDGRMVFTDQVVWGSDYLLEETRAPEGYGFMTPNPLPVTVTQDRAGQTVHLTVRDPRLPNPGIEKKSDPESGSVVQPGTLITYSVTASNTGGMAIPAAEALVVDTLPNGLWFEGMVAADPAQPEPEVTINDDGTTTLRWQIGELAAGKSVTLRYEAVVLDDVPQGTVLENEAEFLDMRDTTTHLVPTGDLAIVKTANPPSGDFVLVGDEITYTMTVTASGDLDQRDVVVADYVPGTDPDLSESIKTTYVRGSAKCSGDCAVTEPGSDGMVIWELGDLPAGESQSVSFTVKVAEVNVTGTGTVHVGDVLNVAWAESVAVPPTASNRTEHPVSVVLGTKVTNPLQPTPGKPGTAPVRHTPPVKTVGKNLPRTGAEIGTALWLGGALLLLGGALVLVTRDRRRPAHRQ